MKIVVTGAGGFLGRHLVKSLIDKGHDVYNFSRNDYPDLEQIGVTTIKGNLKDFDSVSNAFKGMDVVFHLASLVGMWGDYKDYFETNVTGVQNVIKACSDNNIKKLIYTSSPSVVFGKKSLCGVNEDQPYPRRYLNHYAKTKALGEKEILNANSNILATIALRPHLIFGPGDTHLFPKILEQARNGRLKQIGSGTNQVDIIYVQNAVDAHINAMDKLEINSNVSGKAYFIGQERPVNLWAFIDEILKRYKVKPIETQVSAKIVYRIGAVLEFIYRIFGVKKEPPMTRFIAKQLSCSHYFNHEKAYKDLGYYPKVTIEEALDITTR